jgi:hypothetical protein
MRILGKRVPVKRYEMSMEHYMNYTLRKGFEIRNGYSRPTADVQIIMVLVVCAVVNEREGEEQTESQSRNVKKRKRIKDISTNYSLMAVILLFQFAICWESHHTVMQQENFSPHG